MQQRLTRPPGLFLRVFPILRPASPAATVMKLGGKLIVCLFVTLLLTMTIHGYLSIQQEQETVDRELGLGMRGFARVVHAALRDLYADNQNLRATRDFVKAVGPRGNVHGLVVWRP